jgi:hypothetical protein
MKTTRRFLLVASLALALAFTISCSDDDSPSLTIACASSPTSEVSEYGGRDQYGKPCPDCYTCQEWYDADKYKTKIKEECEEDEYNTGHRVLKECPKGYVRKCEETNGKGIVTAEFYYGEIYRTLLDSKCNEVR